MIFLWSSWPKKCKKVQKSDKNAKNALTSHYANGHEDPCDKWVKNHFDASTGHQVWGSQPNLGNACILGTSGPTFPPLPLNFYSAPLEPTYMGMGSFEVVVSSSTRTNNRSFSALFPQLIGLDWAARWLFGKLQLDQNSTWDPPGPQGVPIIMSNYWH